MASAARPVGSSRRIRAFVLTVLLLVAGADATFGAGSATSIPYLRFEATRLSAEPGARLRLDVQRHQTGRPTRESLSWSADGGSVEPIEGSPFATTQSAWFDAPPTPGAYTVTVLSEAHRGAYAQVTIEVTDSRSVVIDSDPSILLREEGDGSRIRARLITSGPVPGAERFQFTSSDPSVATVNATGQVVAVASRGSALITVASEGATPAYVSVILGSLHETTIVLSRDDVFYVDGEKALIRETPGLAIDRVLLSGRPGGLLARVTGIEPVGENVLVVTKPAGLPDAYRTLHYVLTTPVVTASQTADSAGTGGLLARGPGGLPTCEAGGIQVGIEPNFGTTTTDYAFSLSASYDLGEEGRPRFAIWAQGHATLSFSGASLGFNGGLSAAVDCYIDGPTIPIPVLPLPVSVGGTIRTRLGLAAQISAEGAVTFNAPTVTRSVDNLLLGVVYDGERLHRLNHWNDSGFQAHYPDGVPPAEMSLDLSASLEAYGKGIFGIGITTGGPTLALDLFDMRLFGFDEVGMASPFNSNDRRYLGPYWTLGVGIDGSLDAFFANPAVDALMRAMGIPEIVSFDTTLFDLRHPIREEPKVSLRSVRNEAGDKAVLTVTAPGAPGAETIILGWPADDPDAPPTQLAAFFLNDAASRSVEVDWPEDDTDVSARVYDGLFGRIGLPYAPGTVRIGDESPDDCAGPDCDPSTPPDGGPGHGFGDPNDTGQPGAPGSIGGGGIGGPGGDGSGGPGDHGGDGGVTYGSGNLGHTSGSTGDPHLISFDGLRFNFQAAGEFVLAATTNLVGDVDPSGDLEIQVRQRPIQEGVLGAINTAVGVRMGTHQIAIYANPQPGDTRLEVNGQMVADPTGAPLHFPGHGALYANGTHYTLVWPDGSRLRVNRGYRHLDLMIALADSRQNRTIGLLGEFDGSRANDLKPREGSAMAPPINYHQLYDLLGDSWRVRQGDQLIHPSRGDGDPTDLQFPGSFPPEIDPGTRDLAGRLCIAGGVFVRGVLQACTYDVALLLTATPPDEAMITAIIEGHVASQRDLFGDDGSGEVAIYLVAAAPEVAPGSTTQLRPSVHGTANTEVTWSVTGGAIDVDGRWTAPTTPGTYDIQVTSVADPSKTATVSIEVFPTTFTSLADWQLGSPAGSGDWWVSTDGTSVLTRGSSPLSWFVSMEGYGPIRLEARIVTHSGSEHPADGAVGLVFGYQEPTDGCMADPSACALSFFLLDIQSAEAPWPGPSVCRAEGVMDPGSLAQFRDHVSSSSFHCPVPPAAGSQTWSGNTPLHLEVEIRTREATIRVSHESNGLLAEYTVHANDFGLPFFPAGRIGFYTRGTVANRFEDVLITPLPN